MKPVDVFLAEATQFSKDELIEILAGVKALVREACSFDLRPHGKRYRLTPLDEMEFHELLKRSIAIEESWGYRLAACHSREVGNRLTLAQAYAVLRIRCGHGTMWLDHYKQAYSFPFEMLITHNGCEILYLLEVGTYKGSLEMRFRKVVRIDDPRLRNRYYYPPEEEFTEVEQNYFQAYFIGFLEGSFEAMSAIHVEPFVFRIPAASVVFGYSNGEYFETWHDSSEDADKAFERYSMQVKSERQTQEELKPVIVCEKVK